MEQWAHTESTFQNAEALRVGPSVSFAVQFSYFPIGVGAWGRCVWGGESCDPWPLKPVRSGDETRKSSRPALIKASPSAASALIS